MKIAQVITKPERGGAQSVLVELVAGMRADTNFVVFTGPAQGDSYLIETLTELGVTVEVIPQLDNPIRPGADINAFRSLRNGFRNHQIELVHTHSSKAGIVGRLAARSLGIPTVFTAHGWAFTDNVPKTRRIIGLIAEGLLGLFTQGIVTVSDFDKNIARRSGIIQMRKVRTIRNGVPNTTANSNIADRHIPAVVMVARFSPPKNQGRLIEAFALSEQLKQRNVQLQLVGTGPDFEQIQKLTRENYPEANVEFLGNRGDVPDILEAASVFALISSWEGLPMSIIEAMRTRLPVVASDVGGCSELVIDGVTGRIVKQNEPKEIEQAIVDCLDNIETFGSAGYQRFEQYFTADVMVAAYRRLYQEIIARTRKNSRSQ